MVDSGDAYGFLPGYQFNPTDEELVCFYLARKVNGRERSNPLAFLMRPIAEVPDIYRYDPPELAAFAAVENEESVWYFYTRPCRNGSRLRRNTRGGFWKTTERDRPVVAKGEIAGMKKTLVFYGGRFPNAVRSHWVMHEFSLSEGPSNGDTFVLCRVFSKGNSFAKKDGIPCDLISIGNSKSPDENHLTDTMMDEPQTPTQETEAPLEDMLYAMDDQYRHVIEMEASLKDMICALRNTMKQQGSRVTEIEASLKEILSVIKKGRDDQYTFVTEIEASLKEIMSVIKKGRDDQYTFVTEIEASSEDMECEEQDQQDTPVTEIKASLKEIMSAIKKAWDDQYNSVTEIEASSEDMECDEEYQQDTPVKVTRAPFEDMMSEPETETDEQDTPVTEIEAPFEDMMSESETETDEPRTPDKKIAVPFKDMMCKEKGPKDEQNTPDTGIEAPYRFLLCYEEYNFSESDTEEMAEDNSSYDLIYLYLWTCLKVSDIEEGGYNPLPATVLVPPILPNPYHVAGGWYFNADQFQDQEFMDDDDGSLPPDIVTGDFLELDDLTSP